MLVKIPRFLFVFLSLIQPVSAQDIFSSSRTQMNKIWIDQKTSEPDSVNLTTDGKQLVFYSFRQSSLPVLPLLMVRENSGVLVAGVSLHLTSDSLKNWYLFSLSELLLEWIRMDSDETSAQIRSEQIEISVNGVILNSVNQNQIFKIASVFSKSDPIILSVTQNRTSFSAGAINGELVLVSLPNRVDLLSGRTKEELDNDLARRLNVPVSFSNPDLSSGSQIQRFAGKELFPGFYSDRFGFENSAGFLPAWDPTQPEATLRTLFSSYSGQAPNLKLSLVHHTYGAQTARYPIKFSSLIGNLGKNSDLFVALESADSLSGEWVVTVIAADRQFAHHHLLILTLKPELLFNQTEQITIPADLFTFIRTDNIKSLISGYRDKTPKYQILK
ncbi:MAG: hypothetical protein LCH54_16520 [Bacteroidetes bacterium]|nr:hypothetical protein [Bacteroidota bacterium]